jgi:RNA polymerase sigma factor (TIGR02999 family)
VNVPSHDVTALLLAWRHGDEAALESLVPLVYLELRRLAHRQMKQESPGHVLQTTALLHEAYLRLLDASRVPWNDRTHFFAVAARVMRRVLVEEARERATLKRGAATLVVPLDENIAGASQPLTSPRWTRRSPPSSSTTPGARRLWNFGISED